MTIPQMRDEPRRADDGAYILPDPETGRERSWSRVTTLAHIPSDTRDLHRWQLRNVALGLKARPELLDEIPARPPTSKQGRDGLNYVCEEAAEAAGASAGSAAGTELHALTEWHDSGQLVEVEHAATAEQLDDLRAYRLVLDEAGIDTPRQYIERVVVNLHTEDAGTFDRLLRMPDGRLVVGDLKTQRSLRYGWLEIAIQLAVYANASWMRSVDDTCWERLPEIDTRTGIVMHLPAGSASCALWEVDLVQGWEAATIAHRTRQLRRQSRAMGWPYRPVSERLAHLAAGTNSQVSELPGAVAETAGEASGQLGYLIDNAATPAALLALWEHANPGEWTPGHTKKALARKAQEGWV